MIDNITNVEECINNFIKRYTGKDEVETRSYSPLHKAIIGSVNASIMFTHIYEWSNDNKGWFYKTVQEWADYTYLSIKSVRSGLNRLKKLGLINIVVIRLPNNQTTLHHTINYPRFDELCKAYYAKKGGGKP